VLTWKFKHVFLRKSKGINIFPTRKELLETYTQAPTLAPASGVSEKIESDGLGTHPETRDTVILFTLEMSDRVSSPNMQCALNLRRV
jgi:hypothetical protein